MASYKQDVDKATDEYIKYQAKTLSNVEHDYLQTIKMIEDKISKKQLH